jgi:hypothetical protein
MITRQNLCDIFIRKSMFSQRLMFHNNINNCRVTDAELLIILLYFSYRIIQVVQQKVSTKFIMKTITLREKH